ncbi:M3 family metallopeptidase [Amnimonas aquatica]|uniref:oligopeptidase A n=1 Tax=Amnimonas aquatica TaxID=2094561 RepID=A0A2P6ATT8_9GAMM|nr:M3 family metallopeptidase [Amnimonas aquatica]PQA48293.1 oligopeptidase A [Amnimonas aquatica]
MNALLNPPLIPVFSDIRPEDVEPAIDRILAESRARIAELAAQAGGDDAAPTWDSLAAPLEVLDDRLGAAWSPVSQLNAVVNNEAWRAAYNACIPKLSAYGTEVGQNEDLFRAWRALRDSPAFAALSPARRQAVENALRDFRLSGIGLPAERKQRFAEVSERLSSLTSQFADHVLDATQAWSLTLPDTTRLAGLPDTALALLRSLAEQKQEDGYRVTLDMPSYLAVMTHARDRALREEIYTAYATRASEQGPQAGQFDNGPLISEILALRQEQAGLLGFPHYAALSLEPKMAESVEQVLDFLHDLARKARPGAERDLAELRGFAAAELGIDDLQPWDTTYAAEQLKQQRYALSQEDLKPYFPAPRVVDGLFAVAQRLFGVDIAPAPELQTYHPDVTAWAVREHGEVRAWFYLDLYARGGKRGGAWMADARVRRRLPDGTLQKPIAFLTGNFNPPVDGRPALLSHDEVTTLFHEFGHGIHHMLTEVEVAAVSGINGVAWDAVELPSQFMENWCWTPEGLALISGHVDSGEPLPQALLDRLLAARNFQSGLMTLRQLEFSIFDLEIHRRADIDFAAMLRVLDEVRDTTSLLRPPAWNRFPCSFTHIFAGGYAAGYYSYKWAEVLSADAFSAFEREGVFNADTGRRFRQAILAQGGSRPAAELFREFMGRDPSPEALLRHSGLLDAAA